MMKPIDPQKVKYYKFYRDLASLTANQSTAVRRKVGAVIVLPSGVISTGWNGTPPGFSNICEWKCEDGKGYDTGKTKPEVIHAERNALDKLTRQGVSTEGSILFVTTAPCLECAKSIAAVGIREVHYRDLQTSTPGIEYLDNARIPHIRYKD